MNSEKQVKKLKGTIVTKLPKKAVDVFDPFEVVVEIFADTPDFVPALREDGGFDLLANAALDVNGQAKHTITSRVIQKIDCGFSIIVPKGYRVSIEPQPEYIVKGLIMQSSVSGGEKQRVELYAHNLGKEILVLHKGAKIARMYLTSNYTAKIKT
jgi:dUTPase